jgi:DNA polymerase III alpha subunit
MKTELKDRTLWYDGTSEVTADLVPELFLLGVQPEQIVVTDSNEDIVAFDALSDVQLAKTKTKNNPLSTAWRVPAEYLQLDLTKFIIDALNKVPEDQRDVYAQRALAELEEIRVRGLENLFRALIYVIDRFKETNQVWGVGRGSSCASLVLYLIDLHKVDPIKFGIPLTEFFHD